MKRTERNANLSERPVPESVNTGGTTRNGWRLLQESLKWGLTTGKIFPKVKVYDPKAKIEKPLSNFLVPGKKTIFVRQPGFTPATGYWDKHDKNAWVANKGAAGCGAQTDGWVNAYKRFQDAGYNVVLLTSEKTQAEWDEMLKAKDLPFVAVSLTKEAIDLLASTYEAKLNPVNGAFSFEDKTILSRATFVVDDQGNVLSSQDNSSLAPDACGADAEETYKRLTQTVPSQTHGVAAKQ